MAGQLLRLGLIVPSSNTVMETDFQREFLASATVHTARMFMEESTKGAVEAMIGEYLPQAARMLKTIRPHLVVFGCTAASTLYGLGFDSALAHRIEEEAGCKVLTALSAVQQELRRVRAKRVAVITPYVDELNKSTKNGLEEMGYVVLSVNGMGLTRNFDIGMVTPKALARYIKQNLKKTEADTIFISCTNLRAVEALPDLRKRFRQPIVTSNQAAIAAVKRMIKIGKLKAK